MSQQIPMKLGETKRYIHEDDLTSSLTDLAVNQDGSVAESGSSVEEEIDQDVEDQSPHSDDGSLASGAEPERLEDFAYLDERRNQLGEDEESEDSDWAVDDEDWELANGGQYSGSILPARAGSSQT